MKKKFGKVLPFVQFIPLAVFLYGYKFYGDWVSAFTIGGAVSVLMLSAAIFTRQTVDKIILSINCFLIGGAAMFLFNIRWLQNLYETCQQSTLFLWLALVGVISTFVSPTGFIGLEDIKDRHKVIRLSLFFLSFVVVVTVLSFYFHSYSLSSFALPWLALIAFRDFLVGNYFLAAVGCAGSVIMLIMKNGGFRYGIIVVLALRIFKGFLKK